MNFLQLQLIPEWKQFYKMYSVWFFVLIGCAPELFDLAIQYKIIEEAATPALLGKAVSTLAFLGAASRLLKQKALEAQQAEAQA
jgi:hypothetical protein